MGGSSPHDPLVLLLLLLLLAGYYAWNLYKSIKEQGCLCGGKKA